MYVSCTPLCHLLGGSGQTGLTVLTSVCHFHYQLFIFSLLTILSLSFTPFTLVTYFHFDPHFVTCGPQLHPSLTAEAATSKQPPLLQTVAVMHVPTLLLQGKLPGKAGQKIIRCQEEKRLQPGARGLLGLPQDGGQSFGPAGEASSSRQRFLFSRQSLQFNSH
jgi:hypothetical protein